MPVKEQKNLMISLSASRAVSLRLPDFNNKSGGALWLFLALALALCICLSLFLAFVCSFSLPRFLVLNKISKMSAVYLQIKTLHCSTESARLRFRFWQGIWPSSELHTRFRRMLCSLRHWHAVSVSYSSNHLKWQPLNFLSCTGSNSNTKILWYITTTTCLAKIFPHTFI